MIPEQIIECDFAVIGAGMAGISAAIAAARRGLKVCLVHDRPVLGGNASEEVRMWIRGASDHFPFYREGGILEELALDNARYNPDMTYPLWSMVLYNKVSAEPNITLLLNTACLGAECKGSFISEITAFCLTSYERFRIHANYFADCSGDSVLAEATGADFTRGRESGAEYGESLGKEIRDGCTMGNSLLLQAVETDAPVPFTPPPFAKKFSEEDFRYRLNTDARMGFIANNYWWIELGGESDTLRDARSIHAELLATVYGVWDYVKNSGKFDSENWDLHFVGALPAKRETRRYLGDYVLSQRDIDEGTHFDDEAAYGGWTMDDHSPFGFRGGEKPNIFHPIPAPYAIPWRCLYSRNVSNLAFAGRNISVTHLALSSTRVMATCAMLGQAVGTVVSFALPRGLTLRETGAYAAQWKQMLRDDDCYLLRTPRKTFLAPGHIRTNASREQLCILFNGIERALGKSDSPAVFPLHTPLEFTFESVYARKIRILFDSDIASSERRDRELKMYPMRCHVPKNRERVHVPSALIQKYTLSVLTERGWEIAEQPQDNFSRLRYVDIGRRIRGIRLVGEGCRETGNTLRLFSLDIIP